MRNIESREDIINVQEIIKKTYKRICGTDIGADDCAQHVMLLYLEGKASHQKIKHSIIDYLKSKFKTHDSKIEKSDAQAMIEVMSVDPRGKILNLFEVGRVIDLIENKIDRSFFILYYKWGFSLNEIGECFACHESLVSTRLKKTRSKIFKKFKTMDLYE